MPTPGRVAGSRVTVAIRPVGVLDMTLQAPGVPGRIVAKRDAIGIDICEVKVEGIDRPVGVRQRSDPGFVPGRDVFLTLNPEHVLVFEGV